MQRGGRSDRPARPTDRRLQRSRREREEKRQRLTIIIGVAIVLIVGGIVGYGYYDNFVAPPRVLAAKIQDTVYTQGDLLKRVRLIRNTQGTVDLSTAPLQVLNEMVEAALINQGAPFYGVTITDEDVEDVIRSQFYPQVPLGQETEPGQLEQEYGESYRTFLSLGQISDKEYRGLIGEVMYRAALREALGDQIPEEVEHVEVNWISLPVGVAVDPENPPPTAPEIVERLEVEEFNLVAREVTADTRFDADRDGYIGWVPRGAFPERDKVLFGTVEEPLALGEIGDPIYAQDGTFIIQVLAGPEERPIEVLMKEQLKDSTLDEWIAIQRTIGAREGWLEINFDSSLYAWVAEQIRRSAPPLRVAPTQTPAGPAIPAP